MCGDRADKVYWYSASPKIEPAPYLLCSDCEKAIFVWPDTGEWRTPLAGKGRFEEFLRISRKQQDDQIHTPPPVLVI